MSSKILSFYWWLVVNCKDPKFRSIFYCFDFRKSEVEEVNMILAYSDTIFPVFKRKSNFSKVVNYTIEYGFLHYAKIVNSKEFINSLDNNSLSNSFNNSESDHKIILFGKDNLFFNCHTSTIFQGNIKNLLYSRYPAFDFDKTAFIVNRVFSGLDDVYNYL